jgi:hypothetical protein
MEVLSNGLVVAFPRVRESEFFRELLVGLGAPFEWRKELRGSNEI